VLPSQWKEAEEEDQRTQEKGIQRKRYSEAKTVLHHKKNGTKKEDPKKKTSSRNRSTRASNTLTHCPNDWTQNPQPTCAQYASSAIVCQYASSAQMQTSHR